jgi:tetratricopeptide (TPR) repeat protein
MPLTIKLPPSPEHRPLSDPTLHLPKLKGPLPPSRDSSRELSISPRPSPPAGTYLPLPLTAQAAALEQWERSAVGEAVQVLGTVRQTSISYIKSASRLASLGHADLAVQKLQSIVDAHPDEPLPKFYLAKSQMLAGKYDEAIATSDAAAEDGFEPAYLAADMNTRSSLLAGAPKAAATTLENATRKAALTMEMVKLANGETGRKAQVFDPKATYSAREMAEYFAWRGEHGAVVEWLKQAIRKNAVAEISELLHSPFIAPIMSEPTFSALLAELQVRPQDLPAFRVGASAHPTPRG